MTSQDLLIARIRQLSEEEISTLLNATSVMLEKHGAGSKPECPYCGSQNIIRYGHKCSKQRFLCRGCFLQALFPQKCRLNSSKLHGEFPQYCISSAGTLSGAGEEPLQAYKVY